MTEEILTDFGDITLDYDELMKKKAAVISLVINKDVKCSNPNIETFRFMGLSVEKDKKRDNEKLKSFLLEKISSLEKSQVRFLVENVTYKDFDNGKIGQWRLRLDPYSPYYDKFVFNGHSIILECFRKQKRLSVRQISLQKVSRRPYTSEGILLGPVLIIRDETNKLPDETYMRDADFEWLQDLPRRRIDLEGRLNEWNEYISTYLTSINNKQAWIAYRNLERINPSRAKIQISIQNHSKSAYRFFYPDDVVSVLKEKIPDDKEWKPNEDTSDPEQIGTIAEGIDIRKYMVPDNSYVIEEGFDSKKSGNNNREDEWIELEIELDDKYVYDIEGFVGDNDEIQISKDLLNSLPRSGSLVNSLFADKLPLILQEKAIRRLKEGNSVNPRLEDFLFDIKTAKEPSRKESINGDTLVQKALNEKQLEALEKSLNAPDISLIQGPPGTGKTTVIAELCHQTVLRGGKVLIASQSNLAVDNALSRLSNKSNIMPIRIGKHTEEGSDFVEENVVQRWFTSVKENIDNVIENQDLLIENFESYENSLKEIQKFKNLEESLINEIGAKGKELEFFNNDISRMKTKKSDYNEEINSLSCILSILNNIQSHQTYPQKEKFCKFAEIYPAIVDLLNKKLELIFTSASIPN